MVTTHTSPLGKSNNPCNHSPVCRPRLLGKQSVTKLAWARAIVWVLGRVGTFWLPSGHGAVQLTGFSGN